MAAGLSSEEPLPPAGDGDGTSAGTGADVTAGVGGEEVTVSPSMLTVDDSAAIPGAENVEVTVGGMKEEEEGKTADDAPLSRVAKLRQMFDQSTPVKTVGGEVAPTMVSAAAESVDSLPLDVVSPVEHAGCVPTVDTAPAAVGDEVAAAVDEVSPVERGAVEQAGGLAVEQEADVTDVVNAAKAAGDSPVEVSGPPSGPSLGVPSGMPEVDVVDQAGPEVSVAP